MADRSLSYYLGPHLSQGLLNAYNAGRGLLEFMSPGADVRDAVQSSQSAMQNLGQGNVGAGLLDLVYTPAALAGMFIPGSIGGTRRVGEAAVDEILGLVDDVDPSMPSKLAHPSAAKGFGEAGSNLDPTRTGFVFKDVQRKPTLSRAENRAISGGMKPGDVAVLPIRSLIATQSKVNADFADAASSAGELPYVVKKNGEYFVFDGHHRITKVAAEGGQNARVRLVDLDGTDRSAPLLEYDPVKSAANKKKSAANKKELDDLRAALSDYLPMDEASRMARAGDSRAAAGGTVGINGYLYKGGQFLPQTEAPPGTWRVKVKGKARNIGNGRELVAPGEFQERPTPFSRSVMQMMGGGSIVDIGDDGVAKLNPNYNWAYDGSSPDVKNPLRFKNLAQSKETYSINDLVDLYNKGVRWIDLDPAEGVEIVAKGAKKDSANILAGVGGGLLATGGAGLLGAGAYGQQEQ